MSAAAKPVRLELNNSGAWKVLGRFDAADEMTCEQVMSHAEELVCWLHGDKPAKQCPTLRVSIDDALEEVLTRWTLGRGWYDAKTGEAV